MNTKNLLPAALMAVAVLGGCAAPQPAPANAAATDAELTHVTATAKESAPPVDADRDPPMKERQPYRAVPNSFSSVPPSVAAGTTLAGQAPVGSTVEIEGAGVRIKVGADGRFSLPIPKGWRGERIILIIHPDRPRIRHRVKII